MVTLHLVVQRRHGIAETDVVVLWASPPCTAYSTMGRLRRRGKSLVCLWESIHKNSVSFACSTCGCGKCVP